MYNIRRFYRLRELYEADFHKPGIYGSGRIWAITRGTWFFAHRLEMVAVAGLLRLSWCVLGGVDFFVFFFFRLFFFLRTHTAYFKYEATCCLIYISASSQERLG